MELEDLTITTSGGVARAELVDAAASATLHHTMVGASSLAVFLPDDEGAILNVTPSIASPSVAVPAGGRRFTFAAVRQTASTIRLTFEDSIIAALRAQRRPLMYAAALPAGEILQRFATEAGITVDTDPALAGLYLEGVGRSQLERTDSWREISNIASRLGARAFSDGSRLIVATDAHLLSRTPAAVITGETEPLKTAIDFAIDTNVPHEWATFTVDTEAWTADAGSTVELTGSGPANGRWLVTEWTRTLPVTSTSKVRLTRPLTIGV